MASNNERNDSPKKHKGDNEISKFNKTFSASSLSSNNSFVENKNSFDLHSEDLRRKENKSFDYDFIKKNEFYFNYECEKYGLKDFYPSSKHTIMFDHLSLSYKDHSGPPLPLTLKTDVWDEDHVKLPCSPLNVNENGQPIWKEITQRLKKLSDTLIKDPDSLHINYAIKMYNEKYKLNWNFKVLDYFFNEELEGRKGEHILKDLFPKIIKLALDLPNQITSPIPILKAGKSHSISLSQAQCASILANAFFCTFPDRYDSSTKLPYINFNGIFNGSKYNRGDVKIQKLKFDFITTSKYLKKQVPEGVITFTRQHVADNEIPDFRNSTKKFRKAIIQLDGTIEDCIGTIQLDFANKYLGGGVLNTGAVQEEIRFMICPELLVSMLFTEVMDSNESVLIRGAERFSSYNGYSGSFEWSDDYVDEVARDECNRIFTDILAIDALYFRYPKQQFDESKVVRELKKCFAGFKADNHNGEQLTAISTGNWGCGAFKGDRQLKFLIQLMVAAETSRDLIYFTFNDKKTSDNLNRLIEILNEKNLCVGQVYKLLNEYANEIRLLKLDEIKHFDILQFLETKFY